jgi:hypothetical protein
MKRFMTKLVMAVALIWTLIVPATSFSYGYSDYRGTDYSSYHAWNKRHHHRSYVRNHYYRPYRHYNYYYRHGYYPYYYSNYPYYYPYYYPWFSLNFHF